MATQEVISALTTVVQDCLEDKLQAGFDAQASLTLDIAREVANAVENKANEYTDIEITKVMNLITNGEVDLGPFTEFMNSVKTLLDGDENTEGYQIFNTLITDTATNKQTLINHTTSIGLIQNTLNTFQTTLVDHEARITALELAQHEPVDCEDCHDELLNIVKGSISDACTAADATLAAHYDAQSPAIVSGFAQEIDPISITCELEYDPVEDTITCSGEFTGRKVKRVSCEVENGGLSGSTGNGTVTGKRWSWRYNGSTGDASGRVIRCKTRNDAGEYLGYDATVTVNVGA